MPQNNIRISTIVQTYCILSIKSVQEINTRLIKKHLIRLLVL